MTRFSARPAMTTLMAAGATTHSMVMRSHSGTIRYVKSDHRFEKLERFSAIEYRP